MAPKITQANANLLLTGIKGKSRREVEGLLSRVTCDGRLLDKEEEVELRLKLTKSQLEALDRARDVLSHSGHVPTLPEIMMRALADLLEKRDPLRRAERTQARRAKVEAEAHAEAEGASSAVTSPANDQSVSVAETIDAAPSSGKTMGRSYMPAPVRHAVILRDEAARRRTRAGTRVYGKRAGQAIRATLSRLITSDRRLSNGLNADRWSSRPGARIDGHRGPRRGSVYQSSSRRNRSPS